MIPRGAPTYYVKLVWTTDVEIDNVFQADNVGPEGADAMPSTVPFYGCSIENEPFANKGGNIVIVSPTSAEGEFRLAGRGTLDLHPTLNCTSRYARMCYLLVPVSLLKIIDQQQE